MPTIVIENLSPRVLAEFERRAAIEQHSVSEAVERFLEESFPIAEERLPMFVPSPEISAPFDLPYSSTGVAVKAVDGGKLWPDRPISEEDFR